MSHFNSVHVAITNQELLTEAIKEAGHLVRLNHAVRGYEGQALQANVVAVLNGDYDIGFQKNGEEFQAVADFSYGRCGGGDRGLEQELRNIIAIYIAKEAMAIAANSRALDSANITVKVH